MSMTERFLSIQSHVISGYCGNKCITFPLQLLGFEVDVINSVQLSNHTQYASAKGQIYRAQDLEIQHQGLKENNLLRLYDNVLSGYVSDVGYIQSMANLINDIKVERPDSIYCFDPVLGDTECGYYVQDGEAIADAYIKRLAPLADIITPNAFEASILTGIPFDPKRDDPMAQASKMIQSLHKMGIAIVALTSFDRGDDSNELNCILSIDKDNGKIKNENEQGTWIIRIPKLDKPFYGTGDLFAALLTAWLRKTSWNAKLSLENTVNTIHDILLDTYSFSMNFDDSTPLGRELRLIQNQSSISKPNSKLSAEPLVI